MTDKIQTLERLTNKNRKNLADKIQILQGHTPYKTQALEIPTNENKKNTQTHAEI